jgi:hypothetical protein
MKVKPYEKYSIRSTRRWKEAAAKLGLHHIILRKIFFDYWWVLDASQFLDYIDSGRWDLQKTLNDHPLPTLTEEEIKTEEDRWKKAGEDNDFTDLMYYRLKKMVKVGDYFMSDETKTFLSGGEYLTAGKKYRIKELSDKRSDHGLVGFTAITTTNMRKEQHWCSHLGINSLWRGRKEIWNWNLAYLELFKEQNPDYHRTHPKEYKEFVKHCEKNAARLRKGQKSK